MDALKTTMTEQEARAITRRISDNIDGIRQDLVLMYTSEGWRALGYNSWHEYLTGEFSQHHSYLRRQTQAGLLESGLNEGVIGTHRESHLRPLITILGDDDGLKYTAYWAVTESIDRPTARDYKREAMKVYVLSFGESVMRERVLDGSIGIESAYLITKMIEKDGGMIAKVLGPNCSDHELFDMLLKLKDRDSETLYEVFFSLTIPAFPDPIPLRKATAANLRAWLDVSSAEHRAMAVESNRDWWSKKSQLVNELIAAVHRHIDKMPGDITAICVKLAEMDKETDEKETKNFG